MKASSEPNTLWPAPESTYTAERAVDSGGCAVHVLAIGWRSAGRVDGYFGRFAVPSQVTVPQLFLNVNEGTFPAPSSEK